MNDFQSPAIHESERTRILLVDDEETWASSTARLLEHQRESFCVQTATDLSSAATAFAEAGHDCVVCDYQLESGTGLELLADIRDQTAERPFILVTGEGDESVASDAIGRQVTDYIPKRSLGGRSDLLARRIENAVDAYRTRKRLARERRSTEAMLDILRATSSQEGAARAFCDHLVESRGYACAWIGTRDQTGGIVPQAAAGREAYLDDALAPGTAPADGSEPALVALAENAPQVVAPVEGSEGWQAVATAHGLASVVAVPIEHEGTVFGVLAAYGTTPAVGDDDRELLAEYGETVGYALRAAGWKESLLSATPVTVTVELTDQTVPLVALAHSLPADADLQVLTTALAADRLLYVLRVAETTPEAFRAAASAVETVEGITVTHEGDRLRCEVAVSLPTPETILTDRGARVADVAVESGRLSLTVVQHESGSVQALVEAVRGEYPDAGVRSVRASGDTAEVSAQRPLHALTDRQRQALELAFYSGYFQRPREHNTTEVADKLDVSRQTFTQHLRAGQRTLLSVLLDES